jgi:DNA-binding GntR family transcriptional regulator
LQQTVPASSRGVASPLGDQVYAALMEAIAERRLRPGERLMLDELAAQMGVSRTPIRDALARLTAEGLVQPTGRRGFRVTPPTAEDLSDLFRVRLMCELFAVEEGIGNVTPAIIAALQEHAAECVRLSVSPNPADHLGVMVHDLRLHQLIVGLGGSKRLSDLYERLSLHQQQYRTGMFLAIAPAELQEAYRGEHAAIIAALANANVGEAKLALRSHVQGGLTRTLHYLQTRQLGISERLGGSPARSSAEEVGSANSGLKA